VPRRDRSAWSLPGPFLSVHIPLAVGAGLAALLALLPTGAVATGTGGTATIPVSIISSADPADENIPFELTANVPGPIGDYFYNWTDTQGGSDSAPAWEVDINTPGKLTVTLVVTDPAGDRGTAALTVTVVSAPALTLSSPLAQVDAGVPASFFINVAGGVPPLTASWVSSIGGSNGSAGWPSDGNYSEEVTFSDPGPAWILVRVVDVLGDSSSTSELLTEVVPEGSLTLLTNGSVGEVGWPFGAVVAVENGAPPFRWSLSSSLPLTGGVDVPFGTFPADGTYAWSLPFASAGTAYLNLTIEDVLGAVDTVSTVATIEPALMVNLTPAEAGSSSLLSVSAAVSGGLPPYSYQFQLSDGERLNGSLVAPGPVTASFDPSSPGNYSVEFRVTDELGQYRVSTEDLRIGGAPPSTAPGTASESSLGVGFLALAVGVILVGFYIYRRVRKVSRSPPSVELTAIPVVRRLMEESQVIDRETLLLLGEEAGESTDAIQAALGRLIRTGDVTTEPGPGSDEVLRWTGASPAESSPRGPP
jgi:hypothetical protein